MIFNKYFHTAYCAGQDREDVPGEGVRDGDIPGQLRPALLLKPGRG